MNVIHFFDYLASYPHTRELARDLTDAWAELTFREILANAA